MLKQIIHSVDMQQIIGFLTVCTRVIGIRVVRVCGNLQIRSVNSQQSKSMK